MKRIAHNQLVGLDGYTAVFRDLFEDEKGERHSVQTSRVFDLTKERKLGENYPSDKKLFEKHKL